MSTYTQLLYQIVFSTYLREPILTEDSRIDLFRYIHGILKKKNCHLYRINGVEDHIHIVSHIHPAISVSSLVKDIKIASSIWIKKKHLFKNFNGWQEGYGAFTYSYKAKNNLIEYVKNQKEHHRKRTFEEEYIKLLIEHGVDFHPDYLL